MTVTGRLELVAFDAPNIDRIAAFYAELAGWQIVRQGIRLDHAASRGRPGGGVPAGPRPRARRSGPGRSTRSSSTSTCRSTARGGGRTGGWPRRNPAGRRPELDHAGRSGRPPVRPLPEGRRRPGDGAVRGDHRRARMRSALARFYADLLGMEVTYEGPEGALITGDGKSVMFQQVTGYNPPRWPDPAYPQQAHLDIIVDDLDTGEARALAVGGVTAERRWQDVPGLCRPGRPPVLPHRLEAGRLTGSTSMGCRSCLPRDVRPDDGDSRVVRGRHCWRSGRVRAGPASFAGRPGRVRRPVTSRSRWRWDKRSLISRGKGPGSGRDIRMMRIPMSPVVISGRRVPASCAPSTTRCNASLPAERAWRISSSSSGISSSRAGIPPRRECLGRRACSAPGPGTGPPPPRPASRQRWCAPARRGRPLASGTRGRGIGDTGSRSRCRPGERCRRVAQMVRARQTRLGQRTGSGPGWLPRRPATAWLWSRWPPHHFNRYPEKIIPDDLETFSPDSATVTTGGNFSE